MARHFNHTAQTARDRAKARASKRKLLPLPRQAIDAMSIKYHTALAALRMRRGTEGGVRVLLQMVILTGFIGDAGLEKIDRAVLRELDNALVETFDRGCDTGEWYFDGPVADLCAALLTQHDRQLKTAPLTVLQEAVERLERFKRGESYGSSRE